MCNENVLKEKEFVEQLGALEHEAAQADDKLRAVLDAKHNVRHTQSTHCRPSMNTFPISSAIACLGAMSCRPLVAACVWIVVLMIAVMSWLC